MNSDADLGSAAPSEGVGSLPELPHSPLLYSHWTSPTNKTSETLYTEDQMREYARQAVLAERERCALLADSFKDYHYAYKGPYYDAREYHSARAEAGASIAAAIRAVEAQPER